MIKPLTYQLSMQYTHKANKSKSCVVTDVATGTRSNKSAWYLVPNVKNVAEETTSPKCVTQRQPSRYTTTASKKNPLTIKICSFFIGTLDRAHQVKDWIVTILLNQQRTIFKIDTGAQCNVISKWKYYQVCKDPLQLSSANLIAFGWHKLRT